MGPPVAVDGRGPPGRVAAAVAEVRRAVRAGLAGLAPGDLVLAACSGGADSLALAAALAHEGPRQGLRAGAVTVDHGLQPGSAERARALVLTLAGLGLDPVESIAVAVATGAGRGGPEAAARVARYRALDEVAARTGASAVLLGHSRDDQAETVLVGLARGAGSRSLAGMPARRGHYRRPLLGTGRATLRAACQGLGLRPWDDQYTGRVIDFFAAAHRRRASEVAGVIGSVGLWPVLGKRVSALSKGYVRRLMLALALITPHPLLLMDEPFDGFDLRQTREMMRLIRGMAVLGRTLVLAIHQLADAAFAIASCCSPVGEFAGRARSIIFGCAPLCLRRD